MQIDWDKVAEHVTVESMMGFAIAALVGWAALYLIGSSINMLKKYGALTKAKRRARDIGVMRAVGKHAVAEKTIRTLATVTMIRVAATVILILFLQFIYIEPNFPTRESCQETLVMCSIFKFVRAMLFGAAMASCYSASSILVLVSKGAQIRWRRELLRQKAQQQLH